MRTRYAISEFFSFSLAITGLACGAVVSASAQSSSSWLPAADNNGQDFTRPQNLFQIRNLYQTTPANGSVPGTLRAVTTDMTILRADGVIALTQQWSIALRGDLPFVIRNPLTADNPTGQFVSGLGDADVQAALIRQFDSRWAAGAGLRFVTPTGAEDITSGKWRALPVAGARYSLPELSTGSYAEALLPLRRQFCGRSIVGDLCRDPAHASCAKGADQQDGPQ